jgi:tetratricopeptide (TPR) repeat protein
MIRASTLGSHSVVDSLYKLCRSAAMATKNSPRVCSEAGAALDGAGYSDGAIELFLLAARSNDPPLETDDRMFEQGYWQVVAKDRQERARSEMSLGSLFGRRGEYARAAIYSAEATSHDSTLSSAWVNLVLAQLSLGHTSEAQRILNEARQRFPDNQLLQTLATRLTP